MNNQKESGLLNAIGLLALSVVATIIMVFGLAHVYNDFVETLKLSWITLTIGQTYLVLIVVGLLRAWFVSSQDMISKSKAQKNYQTKEHAFAIVIKTLAFFLGVLLYYFVKWIIS